MPARPGILIPRGQPGFPRDLAERTPFTTRQRVHRRARQRARQQTRRVARTVAIGLGAATLALGVVVAASLLAASTYFEVREIEAVGLERVGATELKMAAGIVPGANLFSINPDRVQARLEALPQVKRAQVIRELPNRVTLVIEERVPFALAQAGGLIW
ncbi:MAG TPA: FtsQ-type POTRA domain-containing protein, partial [Methylomirabilota bacterium]|nr:FtsQ-type POTRA domain-containing protein [Methylomirabilota bacterium]